MRLTTKWKNFKTTINGFITEANDLLFIEREFLNTKDCQYLTENVNNWIKKCQDYLNNSFSLINNEFVIGFQAAKPYSSYLQSTSQSKTSKLNSLLDELNTKKKTLEYYLELLSISDAIIQPKLIDLEVRASYSKREIIDLVLDKLYHLYNHNHYPLQRIISGNGLKVNKEMVNEIVDVLESKGYIKVINNRGILVQLSHKGKKFIEGKRNFDLITKYISTKPEIQKIEYQTENPKTIRPETTYHYFEKQLAS